MLSSAAHFPWTYLLHVCGDGSRTFSWRWTPQGLQSFTRDACLHKICAHPLYTLNHHYTQVVCQWLLFCIIYVLTRGKIWTYLTKVCVCWGLMYSRLACSWLCSHGWPWPSWSFYLLGAGITDMHQHTQHVWFKSKLRSSCMLGKNSTNWAHSQPTHALKNIVLVPGGYDPYSGGTLTWKTSGSFLGEQELAKRLWHNDTALGTYVALTP